MNFIREKIYQWIRPKNGKQTEEYEYKVMGLVDAIWIGTIPVFILFPVYFYWTDFEAGPLCIGHGLIYLIIILLTLRFNGNMLVLAHVIAVSVFNTFTLIAFYTGGIQSPIIVLYGMMIPVVYDLAGRRIGLMWSLIYLVLITIMAYIDLFVYPFPILLDDTYQESFLYIAVVGLFIYYSLYDNQWISGREQLLKDLDEKRILLNQQDKMASIGQLTAGIAHEVNNPLNYIKNSIQALQLNLQDIEPLLGQMDQIPEVHKDPIVQQLAAVKKDLDIETIKIENEQIIKSILSGVKRINHITKSLSYVSYTDKEQKELVDIHESIKAALAVLSGKYKSRIVIEEDFEAKPKIMAFPGQLTQVFINIINNAIQAIPENGKISIRTRTMKGALIIKIKDTGIGMSPEVQTKIYEPFFTTKEIGRGTGLGLSISFGIIQAHEGTIQVQSKEGGGTTFTIALPYPYIK